MRTILGVLLVALCAYSCVGSDPALEPPAASQGIDATLAGISTADGIQRREAQALTEAYFEAFLSGCGVAEGPTLRDGVWRSKARVGHAGELLPGAIEVNAKTGGIGYPGCPILQTVEEFRSALQAARREPQQVLPCWARHRDAR